jgi:mRNA-degrading endonuclease RelE of RelBE toxin-antitoxin system
MNKNKFLLSLGSILVCSSALVSFSGKALAKDVNAGPIWNNIDAKAKCPKVCTKVNCKWNGQWKTTQFNKNSVCGCGEWKLDKTGATFKQLTPAEQAKFDIFQNAIANRGFSPSEAAGEAGNTDYKRLQGNQYQIRLSQGNRATFTVDNNTHVVKILQVGGHT